MLPREILRQVRRLQIQARRAVEDLLGGEYHSVFRGTGMAFEEVRAYQPGDDVRSIDWNVTARMSQPFVKRYIEDRERTVLLAVRTAASITAALAVITIADTAGALLVLLALALTPSVREATTDLAHWFIHPKRGIRTRG